MFKISQIFKNHHDLKSLLKETDNRQALQQYWSAIAPEFSKFSYVLAWDQETLTLAVASGAVASKIRLMEAQLLRRFQDFYQNSQKIKGLNLSAIKVKVQVKSRHQIRHKRIKAPSNRALGTLEACAEQVRNPALESALRQFIARQRSK